MSPVPPRLRSIVRPRNVFCALAVLLVLFGPSALVWPWAARAATHISTTTYTSNTTWATAGSPYILDGNVTVAAGATLTIDPGVAVKLNGTLRQLIVNGTLTAVGTTGSHITFTSYQDDSVGGDSNGDGSATQGQSGQWMQIQVSSGNAASHIQYADVRYGANGSTDSGYGALKVTGAGTSLTVEDSTFSQNQRSAILVGTGSNSSVAGVIVRRTTISSNANGISANMGWVTAEDSTSIHDNSSDGLWFNLTSAYSGQQSMVKDSESRHNARGVYLQIDSTLDAAKWPRGTRDNIYENTNKQLDSLNTKRTADWKNNYWGDGVYFVQNPSVCRGTGQDSAGKLALYSSQSTPPAGPNAAGTYQSGTTTCTYDKVAIARGEFLTFPFRGAIGSPPMQAFGCSTGDFAVNAATCLADPVNSATGSFRDSTTDLDLPGTGVSFAFARSYDSIDATSGPLGTGWTHSYNASLTIRAGGDVMARAPNGQQLEFVKNSDGSFTPYAGGRATLATIQGGYELVTYDQLDYRFDTGGKLTSMLDRNSKGLTFAYDGNGRLSTITDASSRQVTLTYDGSGLLTQVSAPGPRTVSYGYTNGRLTSFTDAAGRVWTYTYDQYGFLEKKIDPLSHTVYCNVYGADGRVTEQYDAFDHKTTFSWDQTTQTQTATDARNDLWKDVYSNNVLQKRIDPLNNQTQFGHDTDLNPSSVTGPSGVATTLTYDTKGNLTHAVAPASLNADKTLAYDSENNLTSVTDGRGKATTYGYDANGNNTTVTQDGVTVATYTYNASGQVTSFKDGRDNTTTYTYDANGNLESETDALGDKTTYTHDAAGRILSRVDPRGNVQGANPDDFKTTYTYDGVGRTLTETDPLGHVTTYAYDNASITDANNHATTYTYDAVGRVTSVTAPDTGVTAYTYDAVGNKLTETNPDNKTTTYTYDADNHLASVTTPLGNKTTYSYDGNGNLTKRVDPRGNVQGANPDDYATTYTYDAAGRLISETDALGHTTAYVYDKVGNKTSATDANNHTSSYAYNGRNLLTSVTAPGGAVTAYTYDAAGNVTARTDANDNATTYVYDAANRLSSKTLPLNRQWTYAYDAAGNRTQIVNANGNATQAAGDGTTSYAYDRAGRLTSIDYSDSTPDVTFTYDSVGNRTQMTDGGGTQSYTYDSVNRLAQVTRGTDTFAYSYDLAGNLTRRTYPDSTVTDYTYDDDSRMASAASGGQTVSYAYDAAGNLTQTTLPSGNGYGETRSYDRAGRVVEVKTSKTGSTLADFTYTLDGVGNPTQIVRSGITVGTESYTYDARDRLTEVCYQSSCPSGTDPFIRWTYDPVGNRLTESRPTGTTSLTYNAGDELTSAGGTSYTYDADGNRTGGGGKTLAYDLQNRVSSVTAGGDTTTYTYDGDGNRLQVSDGGAGSVVHELWDISDRVPQLALERDGNNSVLRRYTYGVGRLSMSGGGSTYYYAYDRNSSVSDVMSSSGTPLWDYTFEPFGATRAETQLDPSAPANAMRFTGELRDASGFYYLRARTYDAELGRFLQLDPATSPQTEPGNSSYIYADDRPTVFVDPTGETFTPPNTAIHAAISATSSPPTVATGRVDLTAGDASDTRALAANQSKYVRTFHNELEWGPTINGVDIPVGTIEVGASLRLRGRMAMFAFRMTRLDGPPIVAPTVWWSCLPGCGGGIFATFEGLRSPAFATNIPNGEHLFTWAFMFSSPQYVEYQPTFGSPIIRFPPIFCRPHPAGRECEFRS